MILPKVPVNTDLPAAGGPMMKITSGGFSYIGRSLGARFGLSNLPALSAPAACSGKKVFSAISVNIFFESSVKERRCCDRAICFSLALTLPSINFSWRSFLGFCSAPASCSSSFG